MPRLEFEEPMGGPEKTESAKHRREIKRDNVVVVLKAATIALVIAIVGAVVLLATASGDDQRADEAPPVPEIKTSHVPTTTTTTPPVAEILVPEVRTQTAEMSPTTPPSKPSTKPAPRPTGNRPPEREFAEIGKRCDTPGAYSFTERYEPVVCVQGRGGKAVWRRAFG